MRADLRISAPGGQGRGFDLRPWYQRTDARDLLRQCAAHPPRVAPCGKVYHRTVDRWSVFNPADDRVQALHEIRDCHLTPLFDARVASEIIRDAGGLVTVDMALDAVMPRPMAGKAGDPNYIARLPKIDLAMGRAAS